MVEKSSWNIASQFKVAKDETASLNQLIEDNLKGKESELTPEQAIIQPFDNFFTCMICINVISTEMVECSSCEKLCCKKCMSEWTKKS